MPCAEPNSTCTGRAPSSSPKPMVTNGNAPNSAAVARGTAKALLGNHATAWKSDGSRRPHPDNRQGSILTARTSHRPRRVRRRHVRPGRRSPPAFAVASAAVSTGLRSTAPLRIRSRRHRQEHLRSCRRPEQTNSYARSRRTAPSHGHYGRHHRHRSFALLAAPSKRPATGHGREGHTATASMPARPSARRIAQPTHAHMSHLTCLIHMIHLTCPIAR